MQIKVNISNLKAYQGKLERMSKSAFPIAIRETLNDCAFEYKKESLPDVWDNVMTVRHKTFLKSHSGVQKCSNTFDINKMVSVAGTLDKDLAGEQLAMHEEGGKITDRAVQTNQARVGNSINNRVRTKLRYRKFNKKATTNKPYFEKDGNNVLMTTSNGAVIKFDKNTEFKKIFYGGRWHTRYVKNTAKVIYTDKNGRKIKPNHKFNQKSAMRTMQHVPLFFEYEALRQLSKYLK